MSLGYQSIVKLVAALSVAMTFMGCDSNYRGKIESNKPEAEHTDSLISVQEFQFPKHFFSYGPPLNSPLQYVCETDSSSYRLKVELLETGELKYQYSATKNGRIERNLEGLANLSVRNPRVIQRQFDFSFKGTVFEKLVSDTLVLIVLEQGKCDFAHFFYQHGVPTKKYRSGVPNGNSGVLSDSPIMWRDGSNEPFLTYLHQLVAGIGSKRSWIEKNENYKQTDRFQEELEALELKYSKLVDIVSNQMKDEFATDTALLLTALYFEVEDLAADLKRHGLKVTPYRSDSEKITISSKDFLRFRGEIKRTTSGKVLSRGFENYTFDPPERRHSGKVWNQQFYAAYGNRSLTAYENKRIAVLASDGFEHISFLITVWNEKDGNLEFDCLFSQLMWESIGIVELDTILKMSDTEKLVLGHTEGGDGGDVWGSTWIAIWTDPCELRIVDWSKWDFDVQEELESASLNGNKLSVSKRIIRISYTDGRESIDTTIANYPVLVDTLIKKNLNAAFDSRNY